MYVLMNRNYERKLQGGMIFEKRENLLMVSRSDLSETILKPSPNDQATAGFAKSKGESIPSGVLECAKARKEEQAQ